MPARRDFPKISTRLLAARSGQVFLDRYLAGPDSARPRPLGIIRFGPDTLHDLRSVTKSIVGLLYGITLGQGQVPPPEASLLEQFPEYPHLGTDPARQGSDRPACADVGD